MLYKKSQYFPKPYKPFEGDISVKVDLSNYATKADVKNAKRIDVCKLIARTNLASLKAEINKLDIDKLVTVPVDLIKQKIAFEKLAAKVNNIDISGFVLKNNYETDKKNYKRNQKCRRKSS